MALDEGYCSLGATPPERTKRYRTWVREAISEGEWEDMQPGHSPGAMNGQGSVCGGSGKKDRPADRAQALAVRQRGECHHEILVETPELLDIPFALIASHIPPEGMEWQVIHDLRKNEVVYMGLLNIFMPRSHTCARKCDQHQ